MISQRTSRTGVRARSSRTGMTLIEVVVACSLLAITFTSLTAISVKLAARNRLNAYEQQRTATLFEQLNRVESMPYDSLPFYLVSDSVKAGASYYVWNYTVDAESLSVSKRARYRKIILTVTPRAAPTAAQSITLRRSKSPYQNPLSL